MTPQPEPEKPMSFEEFIEAHSDSVRRFLTDYEIHGMKSAWQAATAAQAQEIALLKGGNGVTREALQQAEAECVSLRKTIEELVAAGNRCIFRENVYGLAKDVEHWRVAVEKAKKGKL